jgi:hypothetical protein
MADAKAHKSNVSSDGRRDDREEGRRADEQAQQKDLNQGLNTGTRDSTRHGVDWGASYTTASKDGEFLDKSRKQRNSASSKPGKHRNNKPKSH